MNDTILFEQQGTIGTMTFNRPQVFNAMNDQLILALRDTFGGAPRRFLLHDS